MYYNTEAIIIKTRPFGEADKIYTILSANYGKFEAKVKSARQIKNKLSGNLEIFSLVKLYLAKGKNIDVITNVEVINSHLNIRSSLIKIASGFYLLELFNKTTQGHEKDYKIYSLLKYALKILNESDDRGQIEVILRAVETRLLFLLGYGHSLDECVVCKKKNEPLNYINIIMGGCLCNSCYIKHRGGINIYPPAKEAMKYFQKFDALGISRLKLADDVSKNIFKINNMFYMTHFNFKVSSLDFMDKVKNEILAGV